MRRAPLLAVALLAAASGRAAAQPSDGRHLLESTAALVVRMDPVELERAAVLARSMGGDAGMAANLVSLASASALGFDAMAAAGWRSIGVDAAQPVWMQIDRVTDRAPELVHLRTVARVADGAKVAAWGRALAILDRPWQGDAAGAARSALAAHLGAEPAEVAAAARALAARGALSVGATRGTGALVLVRRVGGYLVVDALWPPGSGAIRWSADRARVLARLDAPAAGAGVDLASASGAGASLLGRPAVSAWSRRGGALDLARALLAAPETCDADRALTADAPLVDAAISLRVGAQKILVDLVWGLPEGSGLAAALAPGDDGLFPARHPLLSASLLLAGPARLRALPRPAVIAAGWSPLWRRARGCGDAARAELLLFAWPALAGQWLEEISALSSSAAGLVNAIRNLSFVAKTISLRDRRAWLAIAEASLASPGRPVVEEILDEVFGSRVDARRPRPHSTWGHGVLHPYLLPGAGRRPHVAGVGLGDTALSWRLRSPGAAPRRSPAAVFARASGDAAAVLRQVAPDLPAPWGGLASAAATRVGSFEGSVTAERDAVRASFTFRRR